MQEMKLQNMKLCYLSDRMFNFLISRNCFDEVFFLRLLGRLTSRSEDLKFYAQTFFLFINTPRSAAVQWMAIKCISKVRSYVKLRKLI